MSELFSTPVWIGPASPDAGVELLRQLFLQCAFLWKGSERNGLLRSSNDNNIETKAEQSFNLDFVFDIEAKRTCLFQNL